MFLMGAVADQGSTYFPAPHLLSLLHPAPQLGRFSHTLPPQTPLDLGPSPEELDSYTEITGVLCHVMF